MPSRAPSLVLYQFPISHYCEKTRWHLDHKGLRYELRNVVPGMHRFLPRHGALRPTVPVLRDGDTLVPDSTQIALYLEEHFRARPLLPEEAASRARTLALEAYFDDVAGPHVRRLYYGEAMKEPGSASRAVLASYPVMRLARPLLGPALEAVLRKTYKINPDSIAASRARVEEALGRLERELDVNSTGYLVGDRLTLADVTAASLLSPLVLPKESPYAGLTPPASLRAFFAEIAARPAGQWILKRYRDDRRASQASSGTAS